MNVKKIPLKVYLSSSVCGIFYFRFHLAFIKACIFCSTKSMYSLTLTHHNFFQNKNKRKTTLSFAPGPLISSCKFDSS